VWGVWGVYVYQEMHRVLVLFEEFGAVLVRLCFFILLERQEGKLVGTDINIGSSA